MKGGAGRLAYRALLLGIMALFCVAADDAMAASRACRQLEAELASAGTGSRVSPAQLRRYDSAIVRQNEEMAKARSRSRSAGCGFSFFGSNVAACATFNAAIERMNRNLDTLHSKRDRLARGGGRRDRARILAALQAKGCRDADPVEIRAPQTRTAVKQMLDDASDSDVPQNENVDMETISDGKVDIEPLAGLTLEQAPQPQGEFRTMCVRTCDGYFFPMSNAASVRDFERDQKNCESSCPGTQMQVFYMKGMGDDTATMTSSADGRPYSELPTAYLYKKPSPADAPACGCNAGRNFDVIGGKPAYSAPQSQAYSPSVTSYGAVSSAQNSEPEAQPVQSTPKKNEASPLSAEDRKVRVVAPAFLPDPKAAINLRARDRKPTP